MEGIELCEIMCVVIVYFPQVYKHLNKQRNQVGKMQTAFEDINLERAQALPIPVV